MRALTEVFTADRGEMLHAHMARLAVLYEDLQIELTAMTAVSIPVLDITEASYRRNYSLRRCIATLVEFAEAIRLLDECPEFQALKSSFGTEAGDYWDKGICYLRKHESFLELVRIDIGGHFGHKAALFAVANLEPDIVGKIERRDDKTIHLNFAEEIASSAFGRHLEGSTSQHKFSRLMRIVQVGFRHATQCTHCIVYFYLW
jgi:hypothetical protein